MLPSQKSSRKPIQRNKVNIPNARPSAYPWVEMNEVILCKRFPEVPFPITKRLIGKQNPDWTLPNNVKVFLSVLLNRSHLMRSTAEASKSSKSSGYSPRILSMDFLQVVPGGGGGSSKASQVIPMCSQDWERRSAASWGLIHLAVRRGTCGHQNSSHSEELVTKASCYPNAGPTRLQTELAKIPCIK